PAAPYADPGAARPRYSPIRYLPRVNSTAVTRAPIATSDHDRLACGSTLKMIANMAAVRTNDNKWLPILSPHPPTGNLDSIQPSMADNAALKASDTRSRNAIPQTAENDMMRSLTVAQRPPFTSSGFTFQTVSRASWS